MDKIKEKPSVSSRIREKAKAAPKELVHRGLDDGAERLRTQLRNTAQQGRRDDYGGDQIEDAAADTMRRMERGAGKLIKERKKRGTDPGGEPASSPPDNGNGKPEIRTRESENKSGPTERVRPVENTGNSPAAQIKTKDAYMRTQEGTPATSLSTDRTQGRQQFVRERGRKAAQETARRKAEQDRLKTGGTAETAGNVSRDRSGVTSSVQVNRTGRSGASPIHQVQSRRSAAVLPKEKPAGLVSTVKEAGRHAALSPSARTPRQIVRMTDRTRYTGVKTGRTAAQAAQHAKAIRAAQQATQYRMRVKAAGNAVKRAASNAGKALRALLAATRSLMAAAAAGSSVVLSLLIVICIIGLLLTSPFGILFTSEPVDDNSVALNTAIAQINVEYTEKLDELQEGDYDQIIIEGSPPDWREVVAVFAVRTAGTNDGVDVVTLDDDRVDRLRAVFWDMVSLKAEVETTEDDGTILIITIASRTIDEMRELYSFTDRQNNMLDELLDNLELVGGAIGNLDVTDTNAQELLASLPKNLSAERRAVIEAACTLVGKVNYFWGGKSLVIGWDSRWGTTMQVTAAGSSSTGTYRPYGMDCSGYVDWVFYNASGGKYIIGHGGGAASQHTYCSPISWDEALPGDLVFYPGDTHVGIVGGRDTNGNLLIIHCASGYNNVVITGIEGFTSIGRPFYFSD